MRILQEKTMRKVKYERTTIKAPSVYNIISTTSAHYNNIRKDKEYGFN